MKNILGIGLLAVLLSACGGGGYERYEGYWQRQDENKRPSVARITKQDNKTYLINKTVMPDKNGKVWGEDTVLGAVCNWFVKRILRQKAADARQKYEPMPLIGECF